MSLLPLSLLDFLLTLLVIANTRHCYYLSLLPIIVVIVVVTAGLVTNTANLAPWQLLSVIATTRHCCCSPLILILVAIVVVTAGLVTHAANCAPRRLLLLVLLLPPVITCSQPTSAANAEHCQAPCPAFSVQHLSLAAVIGFEARLPAIEHSCTTTSNVGKL